MGCERGDYILQKHLDLQVLNKMQHSEVFFQETYQEWNDMLLKHNIISFLYTTRIKRLAVV
jgi:hypothetical protein